MLFGAGSRQTLRVPVQLGRAGGGVPGSGGGGAPVLALPRPGTAPCTTGIGSCYGTRVLTGTRSELTNSVTDTGPAGNLQVLITKKNSYSD